MNIILEFDLKLVKSLLHSTTYPSVSSPSIPSPWGNNSIKLLLKLIIFFKVNLEQISFVVVYSHVYKERQCKNERDPSSAGFKKIVNSLYFVALNFCFRLLLS